MPVNAGTFSFNPEGFAELAQALRTRLPAAFQESLSSSVLQGALVVLDAAQQKVPVDTGTLKRSLHAEYEETTLANASVVVGTDVEYGKYVELGTYKMAAQPFLRPAVDENHDGIVSAFAETFQELALNELGALGPRGGVRSS